MNVKIGLLFLHKVFNGEVKIKLIIGIKEFSVPDFFCPKKFKTKDFHNKLLKIIEKEVIAMLCVFFATGVNFTIILLAAFMPADPKSTKRQSSQAAF